MDTTALDLLPHAFTYRQAKERGLPKRALATLKEQGLLESLGRGLYRRTDGEPADYDLIAIVTRSPTATLCLTSALAQHDLTDEIPASYDVALPRGTRAPALAGPITWHRFAGETFSLGREQLEIADGLSIGIYSAERSIIDAFRMRRTEGYELGNEALRRWLRRRGSSPASLLAMAESFPRTVKPLRQAMSILL